MIEQDGNIGFPVLLLLWDLSMDMTKMKKNTS